MIVVVRPERARGLAKRASDVGPAVRVEEQGDKEDAKEQVQHHAKTHGPDEESEDLEGEIGDPCHERQVVTPFAMVGNANPTSAAEEPNQCKARGSGQNPHEGPKRVDVRKDDCSLQHLGEPGVEKAEIRHGSKSCSLNTLTGGR